VALAGFTGSISQGSGAVPPDFQFHMEAARATGNCHFADLLTHLGTMIIPQPRVNTPQRAPQGRLSYQQRVSGEHKSIFVAIRNQDPEAARTRNFFSSCTMTAQFLSIMDSMQQPLGTTQTDTPCLTASYTCMFMMSV
jgi:FCD domain